MTLLDENCEIADALPINTSAGITNLGDTIDTHGPSVGHSAGQNLKRAFGADAFLVVTVAETFTSAGAPTAQFRLVSDDTAALSASTATVHFTSAAFPLSALTAGAVLLCVNCDGMLGVERYLGVQQIASGGTFTGGKVNVFFTSTPSAPRSYADNVS